MNATEENFEELFRKELELQQITIPEEERQNLKECYIKVLEVKSLYELDCDLETYTSLAEELLGKAKTFNLFNLSILVNGLSKTSARDLGINFHLYSKYMLYNSEVAKVWNEQVLPIRRKLVEKLKTQAILTDPKKNLQIV